MAPPQPHANQFSVFTKHKARSDDGTWCANNAWDCLNTPAQFGIIFSVVVVTITIVWVYWYAIVRPRQERIKESGQDLELSLGDGRSIIVSSGPHQRTVVLRDDRPPRSPTPPPPPAYRPPTPGGSYYIPAGSVLTTTETSRPSTPGSHIQIWPPQAPPQHLQTPQPAPPQPMNNPSFVHGHSFPGSYPQSMPIAMYPPQMVVPGPPPFPPPVVHPRAQMQTQTFHVIPPPPPHPPPHPPPPPQPPPATGVSVQGLVPPPPPPPPVVPPPLRQPRGGVFYQQPPATGSRVQTRPPSPGHASTIEDDDSDRGGSLPPASRRGQSPSRGRSPPPGGSQFPRSHSPSPSDRRRQNTRRRPQPARSRSPPRRRRSERGGRGDRSHGKPCPQQDGVSSDSPRSSDTSYRSSTSLDSEMRTDLASLLMEAGGRRRARGTERLQALVDRYDDEEEDEERAHRKGKKKAGELPRVPGQPMRPAASQAGTADTAKATSAQQQEPQRNHRKDEARNEESKEDLTDALKRRVAFNESSPEILESRIGRPSRRPQSPPRLPTREDLHHGESRIGRRQRKSSPDERVVRRPVGPILNGAESRIGRPRPLSPAREHQTARRGRHRFSSAGESRVAGHQGRKRRATLPPETVPSGRGYNYYNTHDGSHTHHPPAGDSFLLDEAQSEGPASSAGATCASRSQASSDSNHHHRRLGLTPAIFNGDRSRRGHEDVLPHLRSPSTEGSNDIKREKGTSISSWVSKLASFLPTIARLTTNNPVVQELADNVAVEVRDRDRRSEAALERPPAIAPRGPIGHGPDDSQQAHTRLRHAHRFPDHHQRDDAHRPQPRPSNNRWRSYGRRPSTIPEEPRESLQLALEHAAERLAEGAVEPALDRARHRGGAPDARGGGADVMSGQDDRCRRRPRRSKETEC